MMKNTVIAIAILAALAMLPIMVKHVLISIVLAVSDLVSYINSLF